MSNIDGRVEETFKHSFTVRRPSNALVLCCEKRLAGGDFSLNKGEYETAVDRGISGLVFFGPNGPISIFLKDFRQLLTDVKPPVQTGIKGRTNYYAIKPHDLHRYQATLMKEAGASTMGDGLGDSFKRAVALLQQFGKSNSKFDTINKALKPLGYTLGVRKVGNGQ